MVKLPLKLFAKRCILSSSTTPDGIIAPFNTNVSSSLPSSSPLSSSSCVISSDADNDIDDNDDDDVDDDDIIIIAKVKREKWTPDLVW